MTQQEELTQVLGVIKGLKLRVPERKIGNWSIEAFTITQEVAVTENLRNAGRGNRTIEAGNFKSLAYYGGGRRSLIRSNTPTEIEDLKPFISIAKGNVLIFGLGLGVLVRALIEKKSVDTITVIERESEVIALSGGFYMDLSPKVKILQGDVDSFTTSEKYDCIWFDIWNNITSGHLEEMKRLKNTWKNNSPVVMCWAEKECKRSKALGF